MKIVYVDSGILIAAARGVGEVSNRAISVLESTGCEFASSDLVRIEVLPKATFYRRREEVEFYRAFFGSVRHWARPIDPIIPTALEEASARDIPPMDALHVAAAAVVGADELVTTERSTKPIHRTSLVAVRTIHP